MHSQYLPWDGGNSYRGRGVQRFHWYAHRRNGRDTPRQSFQKYHSCRSSLRKNRDFMALGHALPEFYPSFNNSQSLDGAGDNSLSDLLQKEIQNMLEKHAIEETTHREQGFLSTVFLVPPQKIWRSDCDQSEESKQVCSHRTLQNIHILRDLLKQEVG